MAFGQLVKVDVNLDSIATIIDKKDIEIKFLIQEVEELEMVLRHKDKLIDNSYDTINSLLWYKAYHKHSHHVISKKIIARIEEMVGHE